MEEINYNLINSNKMKVRKIKIMKDFQLGKNKLMKCIKKLL